jgi:MFS family permease
MITPDWAWRNDKPVPPVGFRTQAVASGPDILLGAQYQRVDSVTGQNVQSYSVPFTILADLALVLAVAASRYRGATIGLYSCIGFAAGLLGTLLFGVTLDQFGGTAHRTAWIFSFGTCGLASLAGAAASSGVRSGRFTIGEPQMLQNPR